MCAVYKLGVGPTGPCVGTVRARRANRVNSVNSVNAGKRAFITTPPSNLARGVLREVQRSHAGRDGAGAPRRRRRNSAPLSSRGRALQDLHLPRGPSCRLHCCSPFPTPHVLALGLQDLLDLFEHCLGLLARRAPVVIQCELALRRAARIQTDAGVGACERYVVRSHMCARGPARRRPSPQRPQCHTPSAPWRRQPDL